MPESAKKTSSDRRLLRAFLIAFGLGLIVAITLLDSSSSSAERAARGGPVPPTSTAAGAGTELPAAWSRDEARKTGFATALRREAARGPASKSGGARTRALQAACPPTSVICIENSLPGTPPSQWDIPGAGSSNIQGFATQMSVDHGQTIQFKVNTNATAYRVDIYRVGYYGGDGARQITTISPSAALPQTQPACVSDTSTGLYDCGNWAVSASWAVPSTAVSGVYLANLVRTDGTTGASQIIFVVRDDERGSDILLQTSDATWQAYNTWGGGSLYMAPTSAGRAFKVSYNRPVTTRGSSCCNGSVESYFFDSEYPMIRWIEANGYDVSYTTDVDTASRPALLLNHKMYMSSGHDEYWSNEMRNNVVAAQNQRVNLAFFSGNEMFWKTRWESSIDGSATPFRTLVCYKETLANAKIDPSPQWTGTWRDPRFSPPSDGGRPENAVTGTWFRVNGVSNDSMTVPAEFGNMRLWRNTSIATLQPGQTAVFPAGTLGYEWDVTPDNGVEPPGPVRYSRSSVSVPGRYLINFGSAYGPGTATHSLTLYKASNGALTFGAGTTQWAWGLDAVHDRAGSPTNINMQQATVNLLADMGAQPASLQPGLVPATASTDTSPPTSTITSPASGITVDTLTTTVIQGTASDTGGGVVAGVEVSVDGGSTWHPATGRTNWQYRWEPTAASPVTISVRAVDDIGNLQPTPTTVNVTVVPSCNACTIFSPTDVPAETVNDPISLELGVRFQASQAGVIRGIRFYKDALNTGTHTGNLWSSSGQLLASATFTSETSSGWQQVTFSTPVPITAGMTYVASYFAPSGHYSVTRPYFTTPHTNGPLTALANGAGGGNGVYSYGATSSFPTNTYNSSNYWVDVLFVPMSSLWDDSYIPAVPSSSDPQAVTLGVKFQAVTTGMVTGVRFYKGAQNTGTHIGSLWTSSGQLLASATFTNETSSGWQQVTFSSPVSIVANTTYVVTYFTPSGHYSTTNSYFTDDYANGPLVSPQDGTQGSNGVYIYGSSNTFPTNTYQATNYWVDVVFSPSASLWDDAAVPAVVTQPDPAPVALGVKFSSLAGGSIRGIRFYKGPQNTGTHTVSLWTSGGQLLASTTSIGETASGWQKVFFDSPVPITANTTYVASYHTTSGNYSVTRPYFGTQYTNEPLIGLASGVQSGNGVYSYSATNTFPVNTYQSSNYWVDVIFDVY
ncbi:DUF4082 domain-containing protein [Microtetraspora niveoalba]|uniref:DUF4082 domain-containing protein n=1 Tax=Microtetraspora niveoalba TaxID=46175 RepID=UPI000832518D|nr:DUF4082 domain-containing protein [Microtetraspora niveoalba]